MGNANKPPEPKKKKKTIAPPRKRITAKKVKTKTKVKTRAAAVKGLRKIGHRFVGLVPRLGDYEGVTNSFNVYRNSPEVCKLNKENSFS